MSDRVREGLSAVGTGVLMCVIGAGLYWYLWDFENSTDTSRRIHSFVAMLYNMGGKPLAVAPFALLGVALIGKGAYTLVTPGDS